MTWWHGLGALVVVAILAVLARIVRESEREREAGEVSRERVAQWRREDRA